MIATRVAVRCSKCGGEEAPIVNGEHIDEMYCVEWRNKVRATLDRIERCLEHKINSRLPADSLPDSVALPALNRLEARQDKLAKAFEVIMAEVNR